MKPHTLLSVSALMLSLVLLPEAASAQRGGGRHPGVHHGGRSVARPVVVAGQSAVARHRVVKPGRIGFGSIPVRTGFGTIPLRTGFEVASVHTRSGIHTRSVAAAAARHRSFRWKGFHTVGYPFPFAYAYPVPYGVMSGYLVPQLEYQTSIVGVSAGPSTYFMDLANEAGSWSGLTFEVSPPTAQVVVNGVYLGTVQNFSADNQPLLVVPGNHQVELSAPGYRTISLDVSLAPGQVIPYEGELAPTPSP